MRVLLYGAFGNHNIGDDLCLAAAVHQVRSLVPEAELVVSPLRSGDRIPAAAVHDAAVLPDNIMHRIEEVNRYDALIVGPGGLFEWPHEPFTIPGWADAVHIPVLLFAVGVWPHRGYRALFRKAAFIGVRDAASQRNAHLLGGGIKVRLMPDPVLASGFPLPAADPRGDFDCGFVLRQWLPHAYDEAALQTTLRAVATDQSLFLGFEGGVCEGASRRNDDDFGYDVFPGGTHVPYLPDPAALMEYVVSCRKMIAMRLHGAVLAFRAGIPAAGLAYLPKVRGLYDLMRLPDSCIDPRDLTAEWLRARDWDAMPERMASGLAGVRELYRKALSHMREQLETITP